MCGNHNATHARAHTQERKGEKTVRRHSRDCAATNVPAPRQTQYSSPSPSSGGVISARLAQFSISNSDVDCSNLIRCGGIGGDRFSLRFDLLLLSSVFRRFALPFLSFFPPFLERLLPPFFALALALAAFAAFAAFAAATFAAASLIASACAFTASWILMCARRRDSCRSSCFLSHSLKCREGVPHVDLEREDEEVVVLEEVVRKAS